MTSSCNDSWKHWSHDSLSRLLEQGLLLLLLSLVCCDRASCHEDLRKLRGFRMSSDTTDCLFVLVVHTFLGCHGGMRQPVGSSASLCSIKAADSNSILKASPCIQHALAGYQSSTPHMHKTPVFSQKNLCICNVNFDMSRTTNAI